jgi:hypothetical protein
LNVALALSSAVVALTLVACGARAGGDAVEPSGVLTLGEARAFDEHPLVYAGDQVDGLPLEAILRRDDTARYVSFVYGECRPPSRESGCAPPAEIQVWPVASRSLDSYRSPAPVTPVPLPMPTTIRGLPAAFFDHGTRLEIYAPRTTIVLFSHSRDRVLTIAAALRCLARAPPSDHGNRTLDC